MRRELIRVVCAAVFATAGSDGQSQLGQLTAQIKGTIVDEVGVPLPNARIRYIRKPRAVLGHDGKWRDAPGELSHSAEATSAATGMVASSPLPAGDYDFCIDAPGYLSTCEWKGWRRVTLATAEAQDFGTVQLAKAASVTIRIDDPQKLLGTTNTIISPLVVGVQELSGRFHRAWETGVEGRSRVYRVDVPYNTQLAVWLQSWRFLLSDSTGAAIDHWGARHPFLVALNGAPPSFVFHIAGELKR